MPSGDRRVPFDKMRERARAQVERTSLRHVAVDVGIDYNALNRFINGSKPRAANVERLEAWYSAGAGKVERLERENAELRKRLADCERRLRG
jgi:hypothetical protein